jgi:hypothetical protein
LPCGFGFRAGIENCTREPPADAGSSRPLQRSIVTATPYSSPDQIRGLAGCALDLEGLPAFNTNRYYLLSLFLSVFFSLFLVASPLLEWWLIPVVVPDFILLVFIL